MTNRDHWLKSAARQAQRETWTLGWSLSRLAELEGTSSRELATELNCDLVTVQWLFLCRSPSGERFAQDIERIASRFSLDAKRVAGLVRRADAIAALAASGQCAPQGMLLAARDRGEE